jgi:PAS domain-containing protein
VVVGQAVDAGFLDQLHMKTGLEHLFFYDGEYLAGSIPYDNLAWREVGSPVSRPSNSPDESAMYGVFTQDDIHYYAIRSRFGESKLDAVVALPVSDIVGTQRRLTWQVAGGILFVSILCSGLGIFLVQRISAPLERLRDSANALRKGDLATPVLAKTSVPEIAQVAYALEDARIALKHSMTELRQQKAWVDHLLESVVEGIVTLDRHGSITFFSKGAEQITNLKQEQVLGKGVDEVFPLKDGNERFSENISASERKQDIVTVLAGDRPVTLAITHAKLRRQKPEMPTWRWFCATSATRTPSAGCWEISWRTSPTSSAPC